MIGLPAGSLAINPAELDHLHLSCEIVVHPVKFQMEERIVFSNLGTVLSDFLSSRILRDRKNQFLRGGAGYLSGFLVALLKRMDSYFSCIQR